MKPRVVPLQTSSSCLYTSCLLREHHVPPNGGLPESAQGDFPVGLPWTGLFCTPAPLPSLLSYPQSFHKPRPRAQDPCPPPLPDLSIPPPGTEKGLLGVENRMKRGEGSLGKATPHRISPYWASVGSCHS